ncbi:class I SAM-dependent methyltransferase [Streptomyces griseoaurantiacus]|uniref:class I SAM-dependent methyltransferase n=1 Tax=Streptomyces griseoaurantiacus TaxID=68213 RepID=UPI00345F5CD7
MDGRSSVLEVGCGTGQATRSLAALGCSVTAVEPGEGMAALTHRRLASPERRSREVAVRGVGRPRSTLRSPRGCVVVALGRPVDGLAASTRGAPSRRLDGAAWLSVGRESRRCMPRPPISTSGSAGAILIGVVPPLEEDVRGTDGGVGSGRRSRRIVRSNDCALVSNRSVVHRGRLRRSPSLVVVVPETRSRRP